MEDRHPNFRQAPDVFITDMPKDYRTVEEWAKSVIQIKEKGDNTDVK
jgi:hypothetical protein